MFILKHDSECCKFQRIPSDFSCSVVGSGNAPSLAFGFTTNRTGFSLGPACHLPCVSRQNLELETSGNIPALLSSKIPPEPDQPCQLWSPEKGKTWESKDSASGMVECLRLDDWEHKPFQVLKALTHPVLTAGDTSNLAIGEVSPTTSPKPA